MELYVDHMIIEATRKCNMQCEHCLRGNAQNKVIDNKYVYKMLQLLESISTITITGGEPTLAMDILDYIQKCIEWSDCDVQNFYMVTNGKHIPTKKLASWINNMYTVCSDNEISHVGFSFDFFHNNCLNLQQEEKQKRNFYRLKEILDSYFDIDPDIIIKHTDENMTEERLLREGRAKDFGIKNTKIEMFDINENYDNVSILENEVYLSCNGLIVAGCDWSYDTIDNNNEDIRIAHIDNINTQEELIEAIKDFNKRTEINSQTKEYIIA